MRSSLNKAIQWIKVYYSSNIDYFLEKFGLNWDNNRLFINVCIEEFMKYQVTALIMFLFVAGVGLIWPLTHNRDQIHSYEVPKDVTTMQEAVSLPADEHGMHWTMPDQWIQKEAGGMRLASFGTKTSELIDISIVTLSGAAGGLEANINRWRGQLGLEPLSGDAQLDTIDEINVNGMPVILVWLKSDADDAGAQAQQAILTAIIKHGAKQYFIKLMGPNEAIALEREYLNEFLGSVSFV